MDWRANPVRQAIVTDLLTRPVATEAAATILARHGADLDDYLTGLQIDHDAELMVRRGPTGAVAQARFAFLGITGNSQSSRHDAARNWARKVQLRAEEAGHSLDRDTEASHVA